VTVPTWQVQKRAVSGQLGPGATEAALAVGVGPPVPTWRRAAQSWDTQILPAHHAQGMLLVRFRFVSK
jgi:hypothetical protein